MFLAFVLSLLFVVVNYVTFFFYMNMDINMLERREVKQDKDKS